MVSLTDGRGSHGVRGLSRFLRARPHLLAALVATGGAVVVYVIAVVVFPYHSVNHDEGVYLQQAGMLLEGQLNLYPPVADAFRPWFFVEAETMRLDAASRFYPKYAPIPAAMFALGGLLGSYRFALAGIAGVSLALTYVIARDTFDAQTGLLASVFVLASPLFLVTGAVFLPYAPTTALNLGFATAYVRADRTGSRRWAAVAGVAVGLAFFARPYTAVLFAAPFVVHALWRLRGSGLRPLARLSTTAVLGFAGVLLALGYNATVTGSPWLFPYEVFAPRDGLGLGTREILGHEVDYDLTLAIRSNALVLRALFTDWVVAGPLGSLLAVVGVGAVAARMHAASQRTRAEGYRLVLVGVFVSVVVGNLFFWGNYNILGVPSVPGDGLVDVLGPFYHFDLLLPTAVFGAHGALRITDCVWRHLVRGDLAARQGRALAVTAVVVSGAVFGGAVVTTAREPLAENRAVSSQLHHAYEPLQSTDRSGAVVFLPTPYGDWLNHPFQTLRNDPGYDDGPVYALRENQFAVVDAFPERSYYRYVYHGRWSPQTGSPVDARLQPVRTAGGEQVVVNATLGVPRGTESVSLRLAGERGHAYYVVEETQSPMVEEAPSTTPVELVVQNDTASLRGPVTRVGDGTLDVGDRDELTLVAYVDRGHGQGFTYRLTMPVATEDGSVRALTPYTEVCRDPRLCGGEAAYVPGTHAPGVLLNVTLDASSAKDNP